MDQQDVRYQTYIEILKKELVPAMGCTEPVGPCILCGKSKGCAGPKAAKSCDRGKRKYH